MHRAHIELVRDVITRTVNGEHVDPQEYGLALLACDEALAAPARPEAMTKPRCSCNGRFGSTTCDECQHCLECEVHEAHRQAPCEPDGNTGQLYDDRDPMALGEHYPRHVQAMTAEQLHDKSAIAAELAWRDQRLEDISRIVRRALACGQLEKLEDAQRYLSDPRT